MNSPLYSNLEEAFTIVCLSGTISANIEKRGREKVEMIWKPLSPKPYEGNPT
jgi:hypothetical protein